MTYYKYSDYLKDQYGQKVYKLPVNLPVTCPNRDGTAGWGGCTFCSDIGAGFEMHAPQQAVKDQLLDNSHMISKRYKANKFIAYFQNYSNTYLPPDQMLAYCYEAQIDGVVEVCLSTRPDCISQDHLDALASFKANTGLRVSIELGLQTTNEETLKIINRGHDVATFVWAVTRIKQAGLKVGVHLIPNFPWDTKANVVEAARLMSALGVDTVKLHSLYILKDTVMGDAYLKGDFAMGDFEDFVDRTSAFVSHLDPKIAIQRFFGRAPADQTLFCNWGRSWRYLQDQLEAHFERENIKQGSQLRWGVYE